MRRPAKSCPRPGCPNLAPCPVHAPKPWATSTRSARLPRGWEKLRRFVLDRDPICRICGNASSTEVDHVVPGDDHRLSNLQGVCAPCHKSKTQGEAQRARSSRR
jgi:5-methylcytosine-specific restriction protein A